MAAPTSVCPRCATTHEYAAPAGSNPVRVRTAPATEYLVAECPCGYLLLKGVDSREVPTPIPPFASRFGW